MSSHYSQMINAVSGVGLQELKAHLDVVADQSELLQRGEADVLREIAGQILVCEVQLCQARQTGRGRQNV